MKSEYALNRSLSDISKYYWVQKNAQKGEIGELEINSGDVLCVLNVSGWVVMQSQKLITVKWITCQTPPTWADVLQINYYFSHNIHTK